MYNFNLLDDALKNFDGTELVGPDSKSVSFRSVVIGHLGMHQGTGEEQIQAYDLGIKISNAKDELPLEDAQVDFVKKVLKDKPLYAAIVMGQIHKMIEAAKQDAS